MHHFWALAAVLLILGCDAGRLPEGMLLAPVQRFVVADGDGLGRPVATILDDTRPVLRAPPHQPLLLAQKPKDRSGNRLIVRPQGLPPELREARALLVTKQVKLGASWVEHPPEVLRVLGRGDRKRVRLELPIPANPQLEPVVLTAQAWALGVTDLSRIDSVPVPIPQGAEIAFAIGLIEPDWGFDPVDFELFACRGGHCESLFRERFDPAAGNGWRDRSVRLDALAGETRRFRFVASRVGGEAPFSFPVWGNPTLYAPAPRRAGQRNVILLSIDTLRADHLTSYGYRRDTAPFVDERFAKGGVLFQQPVAAATITTPSHATMFTSLQPVAHGTTDGMKLLPRNLPTLAEWVERAGLDTAAITEDGWLGVRHGFGRGFDFFVENKSANIMDPEGQADVTFAQAGEWLERNRDKHFFLFLHTFQVHTPYAPPERYEKLFADAPDGSIDESSPSHLRWMAEYDREIRYTDDELRRLFRSIDALGLGEDTVFILTSDHGEAFLEHGHLEHGARLDQEVLRVPLLLWGKGIPAGVRVAAPVAHVDLMPTILDLLGVEKPGWLEGLSLLGLIERRGGEEAFAGRALYSEARGSMGLGPERTMKRFLEPAFAVRVGARKLSRYRNPEGGYRYEYYDLAEDPLERRDLYPSRAGEARDLVKLVDEYEARNLALRAGLDRGEPPEPERVFLDPQQEEKLRALGYID